MTGVNKEVQEVYNNYHHLLSGTLEVIRVLPKKDHIVVYTYKDSDSSLPSYINDVPIIIEQETPFAETIDDVLDELDNWGPSYLANGGILSVGVGLLDPNLPKPIRKLPPPPVVDKEASDKTKSTQKQEEAEGGDNNAEKPESRGPRIGDADWVPERDEFSTYDPNYEIPNHAINIFGTRRALRHDKLKETHIEYFKVDKFILFETEKDIYERFKKKFTQDLIDDVNDDILPIDNHPDPKLRPQLIKPEYNPDDFNESKMQLDDEYELDEKHGPKITHNQEAVKIFQNMQDQGIDPETHFAKPMLPVGGRQPVQYYHPEHIIHTNKERDPRDILVAMEGQRRAYYEVEGDVYFEATMDMLEEQFEKAFKKGDVRKVDSLIDEIFAKYSHRAKLSPKRLRNIKKLYYETSEENRSIQDDSQFATPEEIASDPSIVDQRRNEHLMDQIYKLALELERRAHERSKRMVRRSTYVPTAEEINSPPPTLDERIKASVKRPIASSSSSLKNEKETREEEQDEEEQDKTPIVKVQQFLHFACEKLNVDYDKFTKYGSSMKSELENHPIPNLFKYRSLFVRARQAIESGDSTLADDLHHVINNQVAKMLKQKRPQNKRNDLWSDSDADEDVEQFADYKNHNPNHIISDETKQSWIDLIRSNNSSDVAFTRKPLYKNSHSPRDYQNQINHENQMDPLDGLPNVINPIQLPFRRQSHILYDGDLYPNEMDLNDRAYDIPHGMDAMSEFMITPLSYKYQMGRLDRKIPNVNGSVRIRLTHLDRANYDESRDVMGKVFSMGCHSINSPNRWIQQAKNADRDDYFTRLLQFTSYKLPFDYVANAETHYGYNTYLDEEDYGHGLLMECEFSKEAHLKYEGSFVIRLDGDLPRLKSGQRFLVFDHEKDTVLGTLSALMYTDRGTFAIAFPFADVLGECISTYVTEKCEEIFDPQLFVNRKEHEKNASDAVMLYNSALNDMLGEYEKERLLESHLRYDMSQMFDRDRGEDFADVAVYDTPVAYNAFKRGIHPDEITKKMQVASTISDHVTQMFGPDDALFADFVDPPAGSSRMLQPEIDPVTGEVNPRGVLAKLDYKENIASFYSEFTPEEGEEPEIDGLDEELRRMLD
ncbi:hypothetical protein AKO1_007554 [Acrasis kona]|uniref:Uncharacterized protein n=1 Tax=Acrasis kona TaxID=1008807 RepID=A0AAW2YRJ0_9EUKA